MISNIILNNGNSYSRYPYGSYLNWNGPNGTPTISSCIDGNSNIQPSFQAGNCAEGFLGNCGNLVNFNNDGSYQNINDFTIPSSPPFNLGNYNLVPLISGMENYSGNTNCLRVDNSGNSVPVYARNQSDYISNPENLGSIDNVLCCLPFNFNYDGNPNRNIFGKETYWQRYNCYPGIYQNNIPENVFSQKSKVCNQNIESFCSLPENWGKPNLHNTETGLEINICDYFRDYIYSSDINENSLSTDKKSLQELRGKLALYKLKSIFSKNDIFTQFSGIDALEIDSLLNDQAFVYSQGFQPLLNELCENVTQQNIYQGSHTAKICGCSMPKIQYPPNFTNEEQSISCSSACSKSGFASYIPSKNNETAVCFSNKENKTECFKENECNLDLCVIDGVSVNTYNQVSNNSSVDFNQYCGNSTSQSICLLGNISSSVLNTSFNDQCSVCAIFNEDTINYPEYIPCSEISNYL